MPFVANAPMYGFADAALAAEVTKAGGFGGSLFHLVNFCFFASPSLD